MEDLKKQINFDPDLLYYSTPNERNEEVSKGSGLNVVQETYNSSNRKHICDICGKRFFTLNSLKTHLEHHPADKPVKANLEKDDSSSWKNRFVINKGISCVKTNCNFIALDSVDYSKHTASCEGIRYTKENSSSYCESCDCYYSSENYLQAHCVLQHPEKGPNISLKDDEQMNTKISDPVSLYVSEKNFENERSSLISAAPSMYPDSLVTKKKLKSIDLETSTINISEGTSSEMKNGNDSNFSVEPSVSEAVEILKTTIAADSQIMNERAAEIYSENETELSTIDKIIDENLISFEVSTTIQDRPTDEQPSIEINSEEVSTEIQNTDNILGEQLPVEFSSVEISSENICEEQPRVENNSIKIDPQTSHDHVNVFTENVEYISRIEPMETGSSVVAEHPHHEMNDHGLHVLSEICETLSSKNQLMIDGRPKSAELENHDLSCDRKSEHVYQDGMAMSTKPADATVQGNNVTNVCSRSESAVKNPPVNHERLSNYTQQASSSTTSEYHVLLAAAASLGDELLSITETSGDENRIFELKSTATSKQPKNISQLKSTSVPTKRKYVKKSEKFLTKKITKFIPDDSISDSESDYLDSEQEKKFAVLASSNLVPKKKSYHKVGKHLKTMTPEESRSNSRSPFLSGKSKVKRKLESESVDSDNLNVKQRSVRQRKKLILPDFEYSLENKADFSDSSTNENSSSFSMGDGEPVKKRGRPRKKLDDDSTSKTSNVAKKVPSAVSNRKNAVASKKYSKHSDEIEEQSEEFSLNTTINETARDSRFNDSYAADVSLNDSKLEQIIQEDDDDTNDGIHSWLKKVDFSEQTSFTSWSENAPKKKLGRPRKKKRNVDVWKNTLKTIPKVDTSLKPANVCNGDSNQVIIKKKKGRPLLKGKSTVIRQPIETELVAAKNIPVEKHSKPSSTDGSPRKRGRPCKVKVENKSDSDSFPSREVTLGGKTQVAKIPESMVTSLKNQEKVRTKTLVKSATSVASKSPNVVKAEDSSSQIVLVKKRGRPRKSVASGEVVDSPKTSNVNYKSDGPSETVTVNNVNNQSTVSEISNRSSDHVTPSVTEADLLKSRQNDLPKTTNLPKTDVSQKVDVSKTVDIPKTTDILKSAGLLRTADLPKTVDFPKTSAALKPADSPKTDQSDSSAVCVPKKRGRPLKRKRLLLEAIHPRPSTLKKPVQPANSTPGSTNENEDSFSEMDVLMDVQEEDLTDELYQEPRHLKPTLWKKKNVAQRVKVAPEKAVPDETQQIDGDLYHTDLRNKSKYSKVFKKVLITTEESQNPDELVICGRCHKKMTKRHYFRYHRISHYYLCWLEDEQEIDLNDDAEISRILQSMVNPDALRKKAIRLACERCDKVMKSVVGYVSHVRFCQKKDENELLEKCQLCPRALKPSSIRHHYIKFHGVTKFAPTNDSKLIPIAYTETKKYTIINPSLSKDELIPVTVKNPLLGYESTQVEKVDVLSDEHFWKFLKTSYDLYMCMGLNCRHMTLGKDDLKSHILSCSATFCEFTCMSCPYMTKYESEIIYHRKKKCKGTSDSEDNAEEHAAPDPDRRISGRVKKKKSFWGYDDEDEFDVNAGSKVDSVVKVEPEFEPEVEPEDKSVRPKKRSKDDDFVPAGEETSEDEGSDDNRVKPKDRSKRQKADISLNKTFKETGLRSAFLCHRTTAYFDPLSSTVEMRLETSATSPTLTNLPVDINEWETFPISDFLKYLPIQHKSPKVSFDGSPFVQLKVFDSDLMKGVPVCNTGGPVWSMAWAPLPAQVTEQYLAVAGLQHMNHVVDMETSVEFPSIVQIWKYGSLDNISNDIHAPTLAWAIAHNFGAVWSMEWCPTGGFDNSSTPCRLGILALATSSGCCVVYSMPRLDCGGETRSIAANPEPDLILKVRIDDVQCTRIAWKRNTVPDTIYGGFSDGTIALWNVTSTSSILKKGKTLYAYRTFQAHQTGITTLDVHWLDNCRFMMTASSDRLLKYWDLEDLSGPMYEHEQTNVSVSGTWMQHWTIAAIGADHLNSVEPTSFICSPRELIEKKKPILNIKDTFWSVAYSDWNDAVATSSNGGCVVVYAARHVAALTYKQPVFEKTITQTFVEPLPEEEKIESESVEANTGLPPTNDSYDCSSLVQNYGIKFCDRLKNKPTTETLNYGVDKGNIKSVNKVCWNQNYNSFNWLALGYDCGFVRVIRVERFDKSHLTKFYKLNENSTITLV